MIIKKTRNKKTKKINKTTEVIPTQKPKKLTSLIIIAILGLITVFLLTAFGFYYAKNQNKLQEVNQKLQKAENLSQEQAKEKDLEQEKNLKTLEENTVLKDIAAQKAADDAAAIIKKQQEEEVASKKYVIADKKETNLPGLNSRETPCGNLSGGLRVWGTGGQVLEGPAKPGPCLGGEWEWYRIRWNDGVEGWSIVDYLSFSAQAQISQTGYITGFTPIGFDGEKNVLPKICAVNQADRISYCNAEINKDQYNYKIVVPAGEYIMTGTVAYKSFHTNQLQKSKIVYSVIAQCGYTQECYQKFGDDGYKKSAVLKVQAGGVATRIDLNTHND